VSAAFLITLALFFGLSGIGLPVALSMLVGGIFYLFASGQDPSLAAEQMLNGLYNSFILLAVPLFILASNLMNAGTISDRLLRFCVAYVGRMRGGLGQVNVVTSLIFSGMSGSAIADAVGIGKVTTDMMIAENRYPRGYAAALTAASAVIGPIIPPSIPMVIYAVVSDASIGYLFLGGVGPGLLIAAVLMAVNHVEAHRRDFPRDEAVPLRKLPFMTFQALPALLMPVVLLYCIYGGATTPTEAAAIAALYALVLATVFYRALSPGRIVEILVDSARSTGVVGLIIAAALVFNYVVASENLPTLISSYLIGLDMTPLSFLLMVNLIFLLLGCLFDATTLLLIVVPLFLPAARELGVDLVHFGVVVVINSMIGLITPPYGVLLFIINAVNHVPLKEIIAEIWLFIVILIASLLVMTIFPEIVLWLPRQFGYEG